MSKQPEQPGFLQLDFTRLFPHKFWISGWGEDSAYPDGFRYKVLSARDEETGNVELVLLLEQADGAKQEMHRAQVKLPAVDGYARVFTEGLEREHNIQFEEQDFTEVRTAEQFDRAAADFGWSGEEPVA